MTFPVSQYLVRIVVQSLCLGLILGASTLSDADPSHSTPSTAVSSSASESTLEAVYLFNFIQFTEWPDNKIDAPIKIFITGDDRVLESMKKVVGEADLSGKRTLSIVSCSDHPCFHNAQVLFIGSSQEYHLQEWLDSAKGQAVLTVSDIPGFAKRGGMIELVRRHNRLTFLINRRAITESGLYISAQLLQLGEITNRNHP